MQNKPFTNTYTLLTAENILRQLNVTFPKDSLIHILNQNEAFYKRVLAPFCDYIVNQKLIDYCETLDEFNNAELKHLTTSYKNYMKRNEMEVTETDKTLSEFANIRDQMNVLKFRRNKAIDKQQVLLNAMTEHVQKAIQEWKILQNQHAEKLTNALIADGYSLPTHFQEKLAEQLIYQTFKPKTIPDKLLKILNIKNNLPTMTEKALISALTEEEPSDAV